MSDLAQRLKELEAIAQSRKLTDDEAKEVVRLVRQDRISASYASAGAKAARAPAVKKDPAAVMAKLQDMFKASPPKE